MDMSSDIFPDAETSDLEKDRVRLWLRILKISRAVETELRERMRTRYKSTLPRFDVMAALYRHREGLKMTELSAALRVSNGNVTGIIERLVTEHFVERVPIPNDRRAMKVRLTQKGREEFAPMARTHQIWINEMLQEIDETDAAVVSSLLDINLNINRSSKSGGGKNE